MQPSVSIICLIYKSTKYLDFVYDQVKKYTDLSDKEFYFVANDASQEVLDHLKNTNAPHYVFNNTPENVRLQREGLQTYLPNVYRAWNFGASKANGKYLLFINSDMAFSKNWFENLWKWKTDTNCVTSRLVESGRYTSGTHGISYNCGQFLRDYNEQKFLDYVKSIEVDKCEPNGLYMPLLITKEHFDKVNGYPEGNCIPGSDIFHPSIANKEQNPWSVPGDVVIMHKLRCFGISHITSFNSIVYHFQNGEMFE